MPTAKRKPYSARRYDVLIGPGGYLTVLRAGHPMRADRYRTWVRVMKVRVPKRHGDLSLEGARQIKTWAVWAYNL